MQQPNRRIYVKHELFEGWATVTGYFRGEILPFEIELDEGDDSGHKFKRVSKESIMDMTSPSPSPEEPQEVKIEQLTLF